MKTLQYFCTKCGRHNPHYEQLNDNFPSTWHCIICGKEFKGKRQEGTLPYIKDCSRWNHRWLGIESKEGYIWG